MSIKTLKVLPPRHPNSNCLESKKITDDGSSEIPLDDEIYNIPNITGTQRFAIKMLLV